MNPKTRPDVLSRILKSVAKCLDHDSARRLAALRLDKRTQADLERWAHQSSAGRLTPEERSQYLAVVDALDLLTILQIEARRRLRKKPRATVS